MPHRSTPTRPPARESLGLYLADTSGEDRREWARSLQLCLLGAPMLQFSGPRPAFLDWLNGVFLPTLAPSLLNGLDLVRAGQMREFEQWEHILCRRDLHPAWLDAGQQWIEELTFPPASSATERYFAAHREGKTSGSLLAILTCQAADFSIPPFSLLLSVVYWWWRGLQSPEQIIATNSANLTLLLDSTPYLTLRLRQILANHGQHGLTYPKTS